MKDRGDSGQLIRIPGDRSRKPLGSHLRAERIEGFGRDRAREDEGRNACGRRRECDKAARCGGGDAIRSEPAPHRARQKFGIQRDAGQPARGARETGEAKNRIRRLRDGRNDANASALKPDPRLAKRQSYRHLLDISASTAGRQDDAVRRRPREGAEIVIKRGGVRR